MSDESTPPPKASALSVALRKFMFTMGVLTVVLLMGGYVLPRLLFPPEEPPAPTIAEPQEAVAPLPAPENNQLAELDAKVEALATLVTQSPTSPEAPAAAEPEEEEENAAPASRLDALEAKLSQQSAEIAALKGQLDAFKKESETRLAVQVALRGLQEAIHSAVSFEAPLTTLKRLSAGHPDADEPLAQLSAYAATGVPSLTYLQHAFEQAVPRALAKPATSLLDNARSLVTIRKIGETQQGSDDESIIARAEAKLQRGEVEASAKELQALSDNAKRAMEPWLTHAHAYAHARALAASLEQALTHE